MKLFTTLAACGAFLLGACTSTTFVSTWKAPEAKTFQASGQKVAAVFIGKDEAQRRVAEDTLVQQINSRGAQGIATYDLIPSSELENLDSVKSRLADAGVEGVVAMRVIEEKERVSVSYSAPRPTFAPYYWDFWSYWGYGWGRAYQPAEVRTDTILSMETLVYSLQDDKDTLVWAGTSRTVNPDKVDELVTEVAQAASREMTRQGLLPNGEGGARSARTANQASARTAD
jgi:hypothetical protein